MRAPDLVGRTVVDDDGDCIDGDLTDLSDSVANPSEASSVDPDDETTESEDDLSDPSGSDDDFGENKKATRPSKRRKTLSASTQTAKATKKRPSRKVQGRLRDMLVMPLDILYEIFCLLEPADLLRLARTSKSLRTVLMSRRSQFAWAAARKHALGPAVPEPPEDMCEPSWANLLFGGAICSNCGTKGIHRIDFCLRMRLCVKCRKENLVYGAKFEKKCPDADPDVVELLEYTHTGGWSHGHASSKKFYWKPSIDKMEAKLATLKKAVVMNKPSARKALEDFRQERFTHISAMQQSQFVFQNWVRATTEWRQIEGSSRLNEIRRRLVALGYDEHEMDTSDFTTLKEVRAKAQITDRIWSRIQGTLEEHLIQARENRVAAQRYYVRCDREREAQRCIENYTQNTLPIQRLYLPPVEATSSFLCFKPLFDRDVSSTVTAAEWQAAAADLPASLMQWMHETREEYTAMLPESYRIVSAPMQLAFMPVTAETRSAMARFAGPLELAVSVFVNRHGWWFIGRDIFSAIQSSHPQNLQFSERGSAAAAAVATTAGKIPNQVTASELDADDLRFFCTDCYERNGGVTQGLLVYCWRACVNHYATSLDHPVPRWMRLSVEETINVKKKEPTVASHWSNHWSCNHCTATYFATDRPRDPVVTHIRTAHGISDPVENQDFFYRPRSWIYQQTFPPPTLLTPRPPPKVTPQFSCVHCPGTARLFIFDGVKSHLRAKHKVLVPLENIDYLDKGPSQNAQGPSNTMPARLP